MSLRVYNTLSRKIEDFKTLKEGEVKVYICGLTVYDMMHIGHARTYIAFDSILRYLKYRGFNVKHIQNVTDIDDKIIKRAKERDRDPLDLSKEFTEKCSEDQRSLGLLEADNYPKVSETIPDIIKAVEKLISQGNAYEVDGDVYFDVSSFPDYGKLSNQDVKQLTKHRIEPNPAKKNPTDFGLWKKVDDSEVGFDSPWGHGRPGWHIECSVMSEKYLGGQFDIHGGALDLIFPHHENEIAQSESLTGKKPFVKYWLHTGFLQSSGEKMSKSLGNILSVRDFLEKYSADVLRLFVLQTHYRSPIDYSTENIKNIENSLERLSNFRKELESALEKAGDNGENKVEELTTKLKEDFTAVMDDDFNTPKALGAVFDAVRAINPLLTELSDSKESIQNSIILFDEILSVFGLDLKPAVVEVTDEIRKLVEERNKFRAEKNWAESDRIRDELLAKGFKLVDKNDGSTVIEKA